MGEARGIHVLLRNQGTQETCKFTSLSVADLCINSQLIHWGFCYHKCLNLLCPGRWARNATHTGEILLNGRKQQMSYGTAVNPALFSYNYQLNCQFSKKNRNGYWHCYKFVKTWISHRTELELGCAGIRYSGWYSDWNLDCARNNPVLCPAAAPKVNVTGWEARRCWTNNCRNGAPDVLRHKSWQLASQRAQWGWEAATEHSRWNFDQAAPDVSRWAHQRPWQVEQIKFLKFVPL